MKFLVSLVVLTLAVFHNGQSLKINQGENADSNQKASEVGWTKLGGKSALRGAAIGSSNPKLKSVATKAAAGGSGTSGAGGIVGIGLIGNGGTDLLEQWCQKPATLESDPIRYLICTLHDAFTNSDEENSSEASTVTSAGNVTDSGGSTVTGSGDNSNNTTDATTAGDNGDATSESGVTESEGDNASPPDNTESGAGESGTDNPGATGSGTADTDPRVAL